MHGVRRNLLAAGLESVTFKCDPAQAGSEACPPSGLLHWNCSEDCPDAECDLNFGGFGLFGTIPEIGDLRCAHRFARVYAPRAALPPHWLLPSGGPWVRSSLAWHGRGTITKAELAVPGWPDVYCCLPWYDALTHINAGG
jgi:hypothetical protein